MQRRSVIFFLLLLVLAPLAAESFRDANLRRLNALGFKVSPSLPVRAKRTLRPKEEIVARLQALQSYVLWVAAPSAEKAVPFRKKIFEGGQKKWLTAEELEVFELDQPEAREKYIDQIGWEMENMWALGWVLGFETEPALSGQLQGDLVRDLVFKFSALKDFKMRSLSEVIAEEDLFYCAHNAVRSAQLGKETIPEGMHPVAEGGAIHERRHGLTWCLSPGVSWDDTDLST